MSENLWYEDLGFLENPFSIKPIFSDKLFGYEKFYSEIVSSIKSGELLNIKGEFGIGKTSLLKSIIENFGGRKKLIYCSCNRYNHDLDIEQLIINSGNIVSRILKKKRRNLILLLDESQGLSEDEISEIYEAYMDNFFKSVVFISIDQHEVHFPAEIKEKIKVIDMQPLTEYDAIKLVKHRLEGQDLVDEKIIKKVYNMSGKNPRTFLLNFEDVFKYAYDNGDSSIEIKHLKAIA